MFRLLKHITRCSKYTPLGRWNIYDKNIVNNNEDKKKIK